MTATQTAVAATMTIGFPGMVADATQYHDIVSRVNVSAVASPYVAADTELRFGEAVVEGTDKVNEVVKLTANSGKLVGVVVHSHAYAKDQELGDVGLKNGVTVGVMRHGRILVHVDEAVDPDSAVRIRGDTNGGKVPGDFCTTTSAGHTILVSNGMKYTGKTTGAGTVELEIDMTALAVTAE